MRTTLVLGVLLFMLISITNVNAVSITTTITRTIVGANYPSQTEGSIVVSPIDNNLLAAGFTFRNPFRSLDGGVTWSNNFIIQSNVTLGRGDQWTAMDTNGRVYSIIWYNADLNLSSPTYLSPSFMIVSNDSGATWQLSPVGYTEYGTTYTLLNGTTTTSCKPNSGAIFSSDYAKLAIDTNPNSPYRNYIYIIADVPVIRGGGGINPGCYIQNAYIRSTDGGKTWDKHIVLSPEFDFGFIQKIAIGPKGELYFAQPMFGGIRFYRSSDGGATFTITNITTDAKVDVVNVAVSPSNTLYLAYVGVNQYPTMGPCVGCAIYLIASTDKGNSWSNASLISEPRAVPYYGPVGPNPGFAPFGPERSTVTVSATSTRVFVAWRDWINSNNATNGDYYAYDSTGSLIRLTTYTGRFCAPPNKGDCTTFAGNSDYMDSTASGEIIYAVYGVDANNNMIPDANFLSLKIMRRQTAVDYLTTYSWAILLILVLVLTIAVYKRRKRHMSKDMSIESSPSTPLH